MTLHDPVGQHVYVGQHATTAAALTWIQAREWDTNGDGTGDPYEGMWALIGASAPYVPYIYTGDDWVRILQAPTIGTSGHLVSLTDEGDIEDSGYAASLLGTFSNYLPKRMRSLEFSASPSIAISDYGTHYRSVTGGSNPAPIQIRSFGQVGANFLIERWLVDVEVSCYTGEAILMPWGTVPATESIRCDTSMGFIHLIGIGSGYWLPLAATGEWYLASDSTKRHHYDGNVAGATEGNLASFDSEGNVTDSGVPADWELVQSSSSLVLTEADSKKVFMAASFGDNPVVFTLPHDVDFGVEYAFLGVDPISVEIVPGSGSDVIMGSPGHGSKLAFNASGSYRYSIARIICLGTDIGVTNWLIVEAEGLWTFTDLLSHEFPYVADGMLEQADADQIVKIGSYGQIEASGMAIPGSGAVVMSSDYYATASDNGKMLIVLTANTVFLPEEPDDGTMIGVMHLGDSAHEAEVAPQGTDVISIPGHSTSGVDVTSWKTSKLMSHCWFLYGSGAWLIWDGSGEWEGADSTPTTYKYNWDGNFEDSDEGNLASFDKDGNIQDSGYAGADFAAVSHASSHLSGGSDELEYRGEVFIPITEAFSGSDFPPAAAELLSDLPGAIWVRKFDPTTQEDLTFAWEVPNDIVAGSGIMVTVVGAITESTAPASGEGVSFKVAGYSVGHGDQLGGTFGTAQESKDGDLYTSGADAQYDRFKLSQSAYITVTNLAAGELAFLNLYRDVADADDDYGQDVGISGIRILYTKKPIAGW